MNVVLFAFVVVAGLLGLAALVGFTLSRTVVRGNAEKARASLGPGHPHDHEESAAMLAPDSSFGVLRLTVADLLYADGAGTIVTIDRTSIMAAATVDSGSAGRALRRPALAISSDDGAWVFAVGDVHEWLRRLE